VFNCIFYYKHRYCWYVGSYLNITNGRRIIARSIQNYSNLPRDNNQHFVNDFRGHRFVRKVHLFYFHLLTYSEDKIYTWNVICRQQQPMPKAIASMYTWSGRAAFKLSASPPITLRSSSNGLGVFSSLKTVNHKFK